MNQWLTGLAGIGVGSVLVAFITGMFSKRKLSAEATKIITDAASGVVEIQKAELARVLASNVLLTAKVEAQQIQLDGVQQTLRTQDERLLAQDGRLRAQDAALATHAFWDSQAVDIAAAHGIELPPPPPLTTT